MITTDTIEMALPQRDPFVVPALADRSAVPAADAPPPFVLRGLVLGAPTTVGVVVEAEGRSRLVRIGDRLGDWVVDQISAHGMVVRLSGRQGTADRVVQLRVRSVSAGRAEGGR